MNLFKLNLVVGLLLLSDVGFGHALLTSPTPRNNNAGLKSGPCGGIARTSTPMQLTGGQTLTITWRETIDHPGRYIFSLSAANDLNFNQYPLRTVFDTQDTGPTPHNYSTTVQIPNINCDACTLQMIQSMEENPASPSYYYSCADVRITATGASPSPNPVTSQQTNAADKNTPQMAGCGSIKDSTPPPPLKLAVYMLLLLLPFIIGLKLRTAPARKRKSR